MFYLVLCFSVQRGIQVNDSFPVDSKEHFWKLSLKTILNGTATPLHLQTHTHTHKTQHSQSISLKTLTVVNLNECVYPKADVKIKIADSLYNVGTIQMAWTSDINNDEIQCLRKTLHV